MRWSDERIETLTQLWLQGMSCSQIARRLGGVTTNAVIGKVHRLRLPRRKEPPTEHSGPPSRAPAYTPPSRPRIISSCAESTQLPARAFRTDDLEWAIPTCSWPIGHPDALGFTFCGNPTAPHGPYCVEHKADAFKPMRRRSLSSTMRGLRRYL